MDLSKKKKKIAIKWKTGLFKSLMSDEIKIKKTIFVKLKLNGIVVEWLAYKIILI